MGKTTKILRGTLETLLPWSLGSSLILFGCGYSQDMWDQKVRQEQELREQLAGEKSQRAKAEADYADALEEIEALRFKLNERGLSVDSLSASLESQKKALAEYEKRMARLDAIRQRFERLSEKLQKLTRLGLSVDVRDNRMIIQLPGDVLFDSGRKELKEEGRKIILQVAEVIRSDKDLSTRQFQVTGHTDNRAFVGGPYEDNWGLSAMRARSVLVLLTSPLGDDGGGLKVSNWSAAGYGATTPVADNATEAGRQKNRRVELVIQPDVAEMLNLNSIASGVPSTK